MTDVVEAMARAAYEHGHKTLPWAELSQMQRDWWMEEQRAAILAVEASGGLVVGKMPDNEPEGARTDALARWRDGHNHALSAVRANAVKVEGV